MPSIDSVNSKRLVVVSGIPAGNSGTGRFIAHLSERMATLYPGKIKLIAKPERPARWQILLWIRQKEYLLSLGQVLRYLVMLVGFWSGVGQVFFRRDQVLILLHPQNLGYQLSLRLLESRKKPSLLYLLDSSFFCVSSYNHLKSEYGSCLKCIEQGYTEIERNGCKPFPRLDWAALNFAPQLQELVKTGHVRIAAQNLRQAELAQRHFGLSFLPPVVGLWTQDWDDIFTKRAPNTSRPNIDKYTWDVLFHGHCLDAKGASWVASVAEKLPQLRFMFPFAKPVWFVATDNCCFIPCSWESALRDELAKARFVIVPSLWSAPIEGALVKSIVCARATLVVSNPTSFCDELPDDLVLKLSPDPLSAADELKKAVLNNWLPNSDSKTNWIKSFSENRTLFTKKLIDLAFNE